MSNSQLALAKKLASKSINQQQMQLPAGTFEMTLGGIHPVNEHAGTREDGTEWFIYNQTVYGNITDVEEVEDQETWDMYAAMNGATPQVSFQIDLRSSYNGNVRDLSRVFSHYDKKGDDEDVPLLQEIVEENVGETIRVSVSYSEPNAKGVTYPRYKFMSPE